MTKSINITGSNSFGNDTVLIWLIYIIKKNKTALLCNATDGVIYRSTLQLSQICFGLVSSNTTAMQKIQFEQQ